MELNKARKINAMLLEAQEATWKVRTEAANTWIETCEDKDELYEIYNLIQMSYEIQVHAMRDLLNLKWEG